MTYLYLALKAWREILIGLLAFLLIVCLGLLNSKVGKLKEFEAMHQAYINNQEKLLAQAQADAALKEKQWSEKQLKSEQNYYAKIKQIKSDADLAQSNADSLSKQLKIASSRLSSASTKTIIEYTNTNSDILQYCIIEYRKLAEKADGHAADAVRLRETWPSN
ncbi:hypothetical protein [Acinetobacter bereziniae]|uniref:hypothetical protein n=1 Tax=Acinetobacter bereziniae TaxID=106648 RepID=UPI00125FC8E2|nr:hypothetical protein [Acinetobacter bereziniae]